MPVISPSRRERLARKLMSRPRAVEAGPVEGLKTFLGKVYRMGRQEYRDFLQVLQLSSRAARGILTEWNPNLTKQEKRFIFQQLAEVPAISTIAAGLVIPGMIETTIVSTLLLNWLAQKLGLSVDFLPSGFRQEFHEELSKLRDLPSNLLLSILLKLLPGSEAGDDDLGDVQELLSRSP